MPKYVICTVGTSIAGKLKVNSDDEEFERVLDKELEVYIRDNQNNQEKQRELSAEINSLNRLEIGEDGRVALLATDTANGLACAKAVKKCLRRWYKVKDDNIKIEQIANLQVHNQKKLRESGITDLINKVIKIIEDNKYQYDVIINPTGGYKGFVPFMTIIGMLFGKKSVYIYEGSNTLLTLPPLPLTLDFDLFDRAHPALDYLKKEGCAGKEDYLSKITDYKPEEENLFMSYVEPEGNVVTISSLAFVLLDIEEESQKPYVLKSIVEDLNKNKYGNANNYLKTMIKRVPSPLLRYHSFPGIDLDVYKPGNVGPRVAFYREENKFYITHAFADHDEYERVLPKERKEKYKDKNLFIEFTL